MLFPTVLVPILAGLGAESTPLKETPAIKLNAWRAQKMTLDAGSFRTISVRNSQSNSTQRSAPPLSLCEQPCCSVTLSFNGVNLPVRVCANQTCLTVPELQYTTCMTPEVAECVRGQTISMSASSGLKFGGFVGFYERIIASVVQTMNALALTGEVDLRGGVLDAAFYPQVMGAAQDMGDVEGCRAAVGKTRYCFFSAGIGAPLTGSCVPETCSAETQQAAILYQGEVWATVLSGAAQLLGMPNLDAWAALYYEFSAFAADPARTQVSCTDSLTRIGDTDAGHSLSTLNMGFSGDSKAQGVAGMFFIILGINVLSTFCLQIMPQVEGREESPTITRRLLTCFDLVGARNTLLKVSKRRETSFLNGMRVWSILWVVLGHVIAFPRSPGFDNQSEVDKYYLQNFRFVLFPAGLLAVDTFFFLSGFLACYGLTDERKGWKKRVPGTGVLENGRALLLVYVDRYVRLTPLYGLLIMMAVYLLQYMGSGPFWSMMKQGGEVGVQCDKYWYNNILYINNVMPLRNLCFGHSWYLSNDFQYLVLGTPIIVFFTRRPIVAWSVVCLLFAFSWSMILWKLDDPEQVSLGGGEFYYRPWIRCSPYLYGLMTCFILRQRREWLRVAVMNPFVRWTLYTIAFCLMWGTVVWQWQATKSCGGFMYECGKAAWSHKWTTSMTRAFSWFYHFAWGLGLLILTLVWTAGAEDGAGGWVVDFLSYPAFEPLYRLTYGVYLIHPFVLSWLKLTVAHLIHYTDYWLLSTWVAAAFGSYLFSIMMYLCIESPCGALWDLISGRSKRSSGMNVKEAKPNPIESLDPEARLLPDLPDAFSRATG